MAVNSQSVSKYDNFGTAKGAILTANDGGLSKYDNFGSAFAAIGTTTVAATASGSTLMMMGVG